MAYPYLKLTQSLNLYQSLLISTLSPFISIYLYKSLFIFFHIRIIRDIRIFIRIIRIF